MNKEEIKEKLKENGAWCTECHTGEKGRYVEIGKAMELVGQIDEPQKPVLELTLDEVYLCMDTFNSYIAKYGYTDTPIDKKALLAKMIQFDSEYFETLGEENE